MPVELGAHLSCQEGFSPSFVIHFPAAHYSTQVILDSWPFPIIKPTSSVSLKKD
jgi:hypothetical protein